MIEKNSSEDFSPDPNVSFDVLLEDPHFIVVEKSAGMHTHPLNADEKGTLYQGVLTRYPEVAKVGSSIREGGLLHRLDHETSGLVLFARTQEAYDFLKQEFQKRRIEKEYTALVEGEINEKGPVAIEIPIGHNPKNEKKMLCVKHSGIKIRGKAREALTYYSLIEKFPGASLLKLQIVTGVRHQIRVHMAFLGHSILGDKLYSKQETQPIEIPRLFLHASRLVFRHPLPPHSKIEVCSKLPQDLSKALQNLSATPFPYVISN